MSVRVLLIDDDARFRSLARAVLDASGLDVIGEAGTAADGAVFAAQLEPDAILLDCGLPDGDGVMLAGQLSALPCSPRVLLTSSDPDATTAEDAVRHGACGFVRKHDLPGEGTDLLAGLA
ncbi:response regulator [Solirubrobacter pauli]|nr:response regulator [Solirubrobacter pauli]